MVLRGETKELEEKPRPMLLYPPQIVHGLTWARTRSSAVRRRPLNAWHSPRAIMTKRCMQACCSHAVETGVVCM
jgi:hypothetical protein